MSSPKICLNMIVKDEAPVICRCLDSIKHLIDYFVIVDTGSKDGTQDIILKHLKDIPGELHERPWVDFSHNRNEAMQLAKDKGDYLLFLDADETVSFTASFELPFLTHDCYLIQVQQLNANFQRAFLVNCKANWLWQGVLHEELTCDRQTSWTVLENALINAKELDGNRAKDPEKFIKDAKILEKALAKEPANTRYWFYLGQTYINANRIDLALQAYQRRVELEGWDQEKFWALYAVGVLQEQLQMPEETFIQSYQKAFAFRKSRVEPLFCIIQHFYRKKNFITSYALAKLAITIAIPQDIVYVQNWIYDYGIQAKLADSALALGYIDEARTHYQALLLSSKLPLDVRKNIEEVLKQNLVATMV